MSRTEHLEANKKLARDYIEQVFNQHSQRMPLTSSPATSCGTAAPRRHSRRRGPDGSIEGVHRSSSSPCISSRSSVISHCAPAPRFLPSRSEPRRAPQWRASSSAASPFASSH